MKIYHTFYSYSFLLLLLVATSCSDFFIQDVDNVTIEGGDPQIVVQSFISPQQDSIIVGLTNSVPILGEREEDSEQVIEDAEVIIAGANQNVTLPYNPFTQVYAVSSSELSILEGETYTLTVKTTDGRSVNATCTVPAQVPITETTFNDNNNNWGNDYEITLKWQDPSSTTNYYNVQAEMVYEYIDEPTGNTFTEFTQMYIDDLNVYTDQNRNGNEFSVNVDGYLVDGSNIIERRLQVYLLTVEYAYYQYHHNLYYYEEDDPFSEPFNVYSNVNGGLGIFTAYQKYTEVIELE